MYNIHRRQHFPAGRLVVLLYVVDLTCFSHTKNWNWCECTAVYYTSVLAKLRKHIAKKWPQLHLAGCRLHHDNAWPHVVNHVMQFLAKFNTTCIPHLPYSPIFLPVTSSYSQHQKQSSRAFNLRPLKQCSRKVKEFSRTWQRTACVICSRNGSNAVRSAFNWGEYFEKDRVNIELEQ